MQQFKVKNVCLYSCNSLRLKMFVYIHATITIVQETPSMPTVVSLSKNHNPHCSVLQLISGTYLSKHKIV